MAYFWRIDSFLFARSFLWGQPHLPGGSALVAVLNKSFLKAIFGRPCYKIFFKHIIFFSNDKCQKVEGTNDITRKCNAKKIEKEEQTLKVENKVQRKNNKKEKSTKYKQT